jgi:ubiquinone/menaquinone biosynthesis C-methylase UbiE
MIPFNKRKTINILDLGAGTGALTERLLRVFSKAHIVCLDGSSEALTVAQDRLDRFSTRVTYCERDFSDKEWNNNLGKFNVIISSLAIHHLDGQAKRDLYQQISYMLFDNGCFLNGDIVKSKHDSLDKRYLHLRGLTIQRNVQKIRNRQVPLEVIKQNDLENIAKEGDQPSPLEDQMKWLQEAGFEVVECIWKKYRYAVIGAYNKTPYFSNM